jgi:hypothetical protein
MSVFSDYVDALSTALTAAMADTAFVPGSPPDALPPASTAVGFIWVADTAQDDANKLNEIITAGVRVYPVQAERFDGLTPIDPTPLYDAAELVQTTLGAAWRPAGGDPWYFEVVQVTFNHDDQYIEAEVTARTWNGAAVS